MSQPTLEAPEVPVAEEAASSGNRKVVALVVVAALVVAAAAAWFFVFSGGDESADDAFVIPTNKPATTTDTPAQPTVPAPAAPAPADVPKTYVGSTGRDPFKPLVVEEVPEATPVAPAAGTPGTAPDPSLPPPADPTVTGTAVTVKLVQVSPDNKLASFVVDGKPYNDVAVGTPFATNFKVYGLFEGRCAGLVYGDESVALCANDSLRLTK